MYLPGYKRYRTSSSVARKAATRLVGSFWMNPTVSVSITSGCTWWRLSRAGSSAIDAHLRVFVTAAVL